MDRLTQFAEYAGIHLISLEQDLEKLSNQMDALDPASKAFNELDFEYNIISGQITATMHLLSGANDILSGKTAIRFGE